MKAMFQKWMLKKMLKKRLAGMPEEQVDMLIDMISENPDFFKKIEAEIKAKKKSGMEESAATMMVMRQYQGELQKMFMAKQSGK